MGGRDARDSEGASNAAVSIEMGSVLDDAPATPKQPAPTAEEVAVEAAGGAQSEEASGGFWRPAVLGLVIAGVFYSAVAALNVYLIRDGMHPFQVAYCRAFALSLTSFVGLLVVGEVPVPKNADGQFVSAWLPPLAGILGNVDTMLLYSGADQLALSEIIVLRSVNPVFATIFNRLIQKESTSWIRLVAVTLFVAGAAVSVNPLSGGNNSGGAWVGRVLCIASAVVSGIRITLIRRMSAGGTTHWHSSGFWTGFLGLLITGITCLFVDFTPAHRWWTYLIVLGSSVSSAIGQCFVGFAAQRESAVVVGVLWNLDMVFSLFWQPVLFHNPVHWYQATGIAIVVLAAVVIALENKILDLSCFKRSTEGRASLVDGDNIDESDSKKDANEAPHEPRADTLSVTASGVVEVLPSPLDVTLRSVRSARSAASYLGQPLQASMVAPPGYVVGGASLDRVTGNALQSAAGGLRHRSVVPPPALNPVHYAYPQQRGQPYLHSPALNHSANEALMRAARAIGHSVDIYSVCSAESAAGGSAAIAGGSGPASPLTLRSVTSVPRGGGSLRTPRVPSPRTGEAMGAAPKGLET